MLSRNTLDFGILASNHYISFYSSGAIKSGYLVGDIFLSVTGTGETTTFTGYFERYDSGSASNLGRLKQIRLSKSGHFLGVNHTVDSYIRLNNSYGYQETYNSATYTHPSTPSDPLRLINTQNVYQLSIGDNLEAILGQSVFSQFQTGSTPID